MHLKADVWTAPSWQKRKLSHVMNLMSLHSQALTTMAWRNLPPKNTKQHGATPARRSGGTGHDVRLLCCGRVTSSEDESQRPSPRPRSFEILSLAPVAKPSGASSLAQKVLPRAWDNQVLPRTLKAVVHDSPESQRNISSSQRVRDVSAETT